MKPCGVSSISEHWQVEKGNPCSKTTYHWMLEWAGNRFRVSFGR